MLNFFKKNWLILTSALALAGIPFLFHYFPIMFSSKTEGLDLTLSEWIFCKVGSSNSEQNCKWQPTSIPKLWKTSPKSPFVVAKTKFDAPEVCFEKDKVCNLIIGEVFETVQIRINGVLISKHGEDDKENLIMGNPFPILAPIPQYLLNKQQNELELRISAPNHLHVGLSRLPIKITSSGKGLLLLEILTLEKVALSLMTGLSALVFCLIGASLQLVEVFNTQLMRTFSLFCLSCSVLLFNLCRIPRQFLNVSFAYAVLILSHILFLYLSYSLVSELNHYKGKWDRFLKYSIVFQFFSLIILALMGLGTLEMFKFLEIHGAFSIFVVGFSIFLFVKNRNKHTFFIPVTIGLLVLLLGKIIDMSSILGWKYQVYYARFTPLLLVLAYGTEVGYRHFRLAQDQAVNAKLGEVAAKVAHDLKSPLAALNVLDSSTNAFSEEEKVLFGSAKSRIHSISAELLNLYRKEKSEATTKEVQKSRTVKTLVTEITSEKQVIFKSRGLNLKLKCEIDELRSTSEFPLSETMFQQILSNLIDNAVEAIPEEISGVVSIKGLSVETKFILYISDNGCGLDNQALAKIGTPGFSFGKKAGNGLGVANAKKAIEAVGGTLEFESQPGVGTTVQIVLPIKA